MDNDLKENIKSTNSWLRGLYMLLFFFLNYVVKGLIAIIAIFQFIITLLTGKVNENVLGIGKSLSELSYQILLFLTYNTEEKPFPFSPWPESGSAKKPRPAKKKITANKDPKTPSGDTD